MDFKFPFKTNADYLFEVFGISLNEYNSLMDKAQSTRDNNSNKHIAISLIEDYSYNELIIIASLSVANFNFPKLNIEEYETSSR